MPLKKNILANYLSQTYITLVGIALVPLYIKYIGAEAYGLVGFFAMLQAWFTLLDMGLTPTIARETSRFKGGATDANTYRRLVLVLEGIFIAVALVGGCALLLLSSYFADDWLRASLLPKSEVELSVRIMAIIIAMRWMGGLYRGIINGAEKLVWLSTFNSVIATFRFVWVLPVIVFIDSSPSTFFLYQLFIAAIELILLLLKAYQLLPMIKASDSIRWDWMLLKPVMKFSLSIAFTSCIWVLVTQTDKLVLSKILPLAEYGYFTLAVLVASGVMVASGPVSSAVLPRMTHLEAQGKYNELIDVYRNTTQFIAIITGSISITLALYSKPVLQFWTGDLELAQQAAPILSLYALGNAILTVSAFPYYLQYVKGNLRLHIIGNIIFVVLFIPLIIWTANKYHGVGAGYAWIGMNLIAFVAWLPLVHHKFAPGLNAKWYAEDVLLIFIPMMIVGVLMNRLQISHSNIWDQFLKIIITGLMILITGILSSSFMRNSIKNKITKLIANRP